MAMLLVLSMTATTLAAGADSAVSIDLRAEQLSDLIIVSVDLTAKHITNGRVVINYDAQQVEVEKINDVDKCVTSVNDAVSGELAVAWVGGNFSGTVELFKMVFRLVGDADTVRFDGEIVELYTNGVDLIADGNPADSVEVQVEEKSSSDTPSVPTPPTPSDPQPKPDDEEVTTNPDGSTTTVTTDKDGNVTETTETEDGTTGTVVTDKNGNVTEVKAEISKEAAKEETVTLPIEVEVANRAESAVPVEIEVPSSVDSVTVEIPVEDVTYSTVVVLVHEDGTEEIVSMTALTEDGNLAITIDGSVTVKVVDNAQTFTDADMWAKNEIAFVTSREIFNGVGNNKFDPNSNMTRAMMMTVLARLGGADAYGADWSEKAVKWAVENGISDGSNPTANITRQDLVTMLYNFAGKPATTGSLAGFTDADSVAPESVNAMKWAVEMGIINGMGDGTLAPQGEATRAQLAKILTYFINL